MPYRITEEPIHERKRELDQIHQQAVVVYRTNEPYRLAYRLREAINAAQALGYEPYNVLDVKISVKPPHVYVTRRHAIRIEQAYMEEQVTGTGLVSTDDITMIIPQAEVRVIQNTVTDFEVVGAAIKNPDALELHFPDYEGPHDPIEGWALDFGYTFHTSPNGGVILKRQP